MPQVPVSSPSVSGPLPSPPAAFPLAPSDRSATRPSGSTRSAPGTPDSAVVSARARMWSRNGWFAGLTASTSPAGVQPLTLAHDVPQ